MIDISAPSQPPAASAEISLNARIAHLGIQSDYKDLEAIDKFGCDAVPALVRELRVVSARELKPDEQSAKPDAIHVAWSLAALRYTTGRDFYGRWRPQPYEKYSVRAKFFLTQFAPKGDAKLFGSWMSNGTIYFSPMVTQKQIIREWVDYAASGSCKRSDWIGRREADFWFFGEPEGK